MNADLKRLLAVLDEQLDYAEQRVKNQIKKYVAPPSENQWYFYVPDSRGIVQVHQDAAFVLLRIFVPPGLPAGYWSGWNWTGVRFTDVNTGRNYISSVQSRPSLTYSSAPTAAPPVPVPVQPSDVGSIVPMLSPSADFTYVLDSALVLPRGGVVRVEPIRTATRVFAGTFSIYDDNLTLDPNDFNNSDRIVLAGYKVYG